MVPRRRATCRCGSCLDQSRITSCDLSAWMWSGSLCKRSGRGARPLGRFLTPASSRPRSRAGSYQVACFGGVAPGPCLRLFRAGSQFQYATSHPFNNVRFLRPLYLIEWYV